MRVARAVFNLIDRYAAVFVVVGLLGVTGLWLKQAGDEHRSCQIQSTGLKAQRELTPVLDAINVFLQPPDRKDPLARKLPKQPPTPAYYQPALHALRFHLPRYLALERKQPSRRHC